MSRPPNGPTRPRPEHPATVAFDVLAASTERLDRFLADQLALSRTSAARLIAAKAVRVNDREARASRTLERGDHVEVAFPPAERPRTLTPHTRRLAIVYEDDDLLVLDKPAGLVVHPAPGHWDDTLLNALVARGTPLAGGTEGRPGIVHRLDKDTSGLLVVAKHDTAHRRLGRALSERRMQRRYAALVWGHLDRPTDVDAPVARHPRDRKRMAVLATGRPARTHIVPVARFDACDLVRVTLETGRTHQIRVHLGHIGHPVVGDPVYGGGGARRLTGRQRPHGESIERAVGRQALHAALLQFRHPMSGEPVVCRAEWPEDLRQALAVAACDTNLLARPNPLEYLDFFE
ncbi:MAG: RluA family pseudouridine synthase [Gemmatimonadales bacterium]